MTINPPDAAVAARSFPRRWRALFARAAGTDEPSDVLARSGAIALATSASDVLRSTRAAIEPVTSSGPAPPPDPLEALEQAAIRLASTIEGLDAEDWAGERIGALTTGIDEAARLLREADAAIEAARRAR